MNPPQPPPPALRAEVAELHREVEIKTTHLERETCAAKDLRAEVAKRETLLAESNDALAKARDERDQLRAEVDGERADGERLDWLLAHNCSFNGNTYSENGIASGAFTAPVRNRGQIDAARRDASATKEDGK